MESRCPFRRSKSGLTDPLALWEDAATRLHEEPDMSGAQWLFPHHDGSETYVPEPHARLGGTVDVLLRVPHGSDVTSAWVRVINDGEPELVAASLDRRTARDTW